MTKSSQKTSRIDSQGPKTIVGFIAKWRHVVKYARALEVNTREKCLDDMETMLDELAELVRAQ